MSALLEVKDLELAYGQVAVCRDISLRLDRGEIVALIGANGAGKSTTLRAIAGVLPPRAGTILFSGQDVTTMPSYERSKLGIALVPEGRRVFPFLTVRENLELGAFTERAQKEKRAQMERVFTLFPRLFERQRQSLAERKRFLAIHVYTHAAKLRQRFLRRMKLRRDLRHLQLRGRC